MSSREDLHAAHDVVAGVISAERDAAVVRILDKMTPAVAVAVRVWSVMTDEEEAALVDWLDGRSSD